MNPFGEPLYATLLVLIVTNTRVILAADSRKNTLHEDGTRQSGSMDKIFRSRDCYYAVSGFSSTEDGSFSLQRIIHKNLMRYPGFSIAIQHLAKAVATELKAYLAHLKKESPELFARLLRDSHSGGEIVLVKREAGVPTAALVNYKVISHEEVKVVVDTWSIDSTHINGGDDCFWRAIGHTAFGDKAMPSVKEVAGNPVAAAKRMLEEGARAHPQWVGAPFHMVELTAEGERSIGKSSRAPGHL
ncbi:MAG TPA: hypothetical protein VGE66_08805 [Chitinophagaceae bacterium]